MSTIGKRVIYAGPSGGFDSGKPLAVEAKATEAILPGSVVEYAAANAGFKKHTTAATVFGVPFFVADKDQQRSKSVDDAWTINENMVALQPRDGEFYHVLVITAQALVKGTPLSRSGTAGALKIAATGGTEQIVAYSDEIVTTSATQLVRIRMV